MPAAGAACWLTAGKGLWSPGSGCMQSASRLQCMRCTKLHVAPVCFVSQFVLPRMCNVRSAFACTACSHTCHMLDAARCSPELWFVGLGRLVGCCLQPATCLYEAGCGRFGFWLGLTAGSALLAAILIFWSFGAARGQGCWC
jgi:hypothetical protein